MLKEQALERKAREGMRMSAALEQFYGEPTSTSDLQAEMERMARETRDPSQLRDYFKVLGDNPVLVAECLARPMLARRKLYNAYAYDDDIHGSQRSRLEARLRGKSELSELADKDVTTTTYVPGSEGDPATGNTRISGEDDNVVALDKQAWARLRADLGLSTGSQGDPAPGSSGTSGNPDGIQLRESRRAFSARRVVESAPERVVVNSVGWPKHQFQDWWRTVRTDLEVAGSVEHEGLQLPQISARSTG